MVLANFFLFKIPKNIARLAKKIIRAYYWSSMKRGFKSMSENFITVSRKVAFFLLPDKITF